MVRLFSEDKQQQSTHGSYETLKQKALLSPNLMTLIFHTTCKDLCNYTTLKHRNYPTKW